MADVSGEVVAGFPLFEPGTLPLKNCRIDDKKFVRKVFALLSHCKLHQKPPAGTFLPKDVGNFASQGWPTLQQLERLVEYHLKHWRCRNVMLPFLLQLGLRAPDESQVRPGPNGLRV
jgi:hypothetical protein